jgi:hypothetical protein
VGGINVAMGFLPDIPCWQKESGSITLLSLNGKTAYISIYVVFISDTAAVVKPLLLLRTDEDQKIVR